MGTVNACYRPTPVIPGIPVDFRVAATSDVPVLQDVLTLSARKRPSRYFREGLKCNKSSCSHPANSTSSVNQHGIQACLAMLIHMSCRGHHDSESPKQLQNIRITLFLLSQQRVDERKKHRLKEPHLAR
jgi:hypothetical protein